MLKNLPLNPLNLTLSLPRLSRSSEVCGEFVEGSSATSSLAPASPEPRDAALADGRTPDGSSPAAAAVAPTAVSRSRAVGTRTMALVVGLAALTAQVSSETDLVRDIQRYCAVCWRNARLDPGLWDDCTQEVCCRLLAKARAGELDLDRVLDEDSPERRELVRAIDMVRKRVQRTRKVQPLDERVIGGVDWDERERSRRELGEVLESARAAALTPRQDRILDLWLQGFTVPEIAEELAMSPARVSDQKYKALRRLERHLAGRSDLDRDHKTGVSV